MRRTTACLTILLALGALGARAEGPDYDAIADSIVNQSLEIQPGEAVLISGGPGEIELMGALQVAVAKAGGQSLLSLGIPQANKRVAMEAPIEHLRRAPTLALMVMRAVDAMINVSSVQDPGLFADVPEERLKALREATRPLNDAFDVPTLRSVSLGQTGGIPTEAYAKSRNADAAAMQSMFWQAVGVSPAELAEVGNKVTAMLSPGASVRVKTGAGTDLSFKVGEVPARINAGRTADVIQASGAANVWLPAGEAYACLDLGSANGALVVPATTFRGVPVENLRMQFENGRMVSVSADSNEKMIKDFLAATDDGTKQLSVVDLGLNQSSHPLPGSDYYSWEMGGMVTLGMGNNTWAGGDNAADAGMPFHLGGATVQIGDRTVVEDGKLVL